MGQGHRVAFESRPRELPHYGPRMSPSWIAALVVVIAAPSALAQEPPEGPALPEVVEPDVMTGAASQEGPPPAEGAVEASRGADLRLVVTGGLSGLRDGTESFWEASIFRGSGGLPLRVLDANATALRAGDVLVVAEEGPVTAALVARAATAPVHRTVERGVLLGPNAIGVALEEPRAEEHERALERGLAAVSRPARLERRVVDGRALWAIDLTPETPLVWPQPETPLLTLPAARVAVGDDGAPVVLVARGKGAVPRAFGIVDRLLSTPDAPPTAYVDVGGALTDTHDASLETARAMRALLLARAPAVLAAGRAELTALQADPEMLDGGPWMLAATTSQGRALPPPSRRVTLGSREVVFVALGGLGARTTTLLPPAARGLSASETLALAGDAATDDAALVVGVALSSEGAEAALTSSLFDGVMHLASSRLAALPAVDDIDLRENHRTGLHAGPGLARVSSADVTEVHYWFDDAGRVERMRIVRHAIVDDGPEAADAVLALEARGRTSGHVDSGLPARATLLPERPMWTQADLDHVLGALVRDERRAELSVLPTVAPPVPVAGIIPRPLASAWLSSNDRVVTLALSGAQLASLFDVVRTRLAKDLVVTGADVSRRTVAQRAIAPLEEYRVAISEQALSVLRGAGLELSVSDDDRGGAERMSELVDRRLAREPRAAVGELLVDPTGRPTHALLFELQDIAASVTVHDLSNEAAFSLVRDARLQTPDSLSVGVNGRGMLAYEGPFVAAALLGTAQLMRNTLRAPDGTETIQELRDVALFEADLRLPLPRLTGGDPLYTPQPGVRVTYDTEWTPSETVDKAGNVVVLPRKSLLRGFAGGTWHPAPFFKEVRAGLILQNDFAEDTAGALEWGAEAALSGEWPAGTVKLKLDSYVRALVPDANDTAYDLGLVFQTMGRVELPTFLGLGVAAFADLYVASGKLPETRGPATSIILGASLTYANRLKWLPFL